MKKIEIARQTNFILALMLIHFVFFGYIANVYPKTELALENQELGLTILFLYQVMLNPSSFLSTIILFLIIFVMVLREPFFEYGIRNSIWLVLFIMIESWIWYWFIIEQIDIIAIGVYFLRIETYLTILLLLGINLLAALLGAITKETYRARIKKAELIKIKKDTKKGII
ncbi:MAG: hypothetical protein EU535_05310 [Promethearchaeota archaeon]|nr:MAG: hypothetical protein EU535_05310 [Candidatus Lokiarchaeota archaeon]